MSALKSHFHLQRAFYSPRLHIDLESMPAADSTVSFQVVPNCFIWTIQSALVACKMYQIYHINLKPTFQWQHYNINSWILFYLFHQACSNFKLSLTCSNDIPFSDVLEQTISLVPIRRLIILRILMFSLTVIMREVILLR